MAKTDPVPVRFTEGQADILKRVAEACGVGAQDVARWAVEALGRHFDHHGGRLLLPLRFHETFTVQTLPTEKKTLVLSERISRDGSAAARSPRPQKASR